MTLSAFSYFRHLLTVLGQPGHAKDLLQSPYVLQVVSYHFKLTVVIINEDSGSLLPIAAIALAATAVSFGLDSGECLVADDISGGAHFPLARRDIDRRAFSASSSKYSVHLGSREWRETRVQDLLGHP